MTIQNNRNGKELRTQIIDFQTIDTECVVEGRAVIFNERTPIFKIGEDEYFEQIEPTAFNGVDFGNVYFYYNHENRAFAGTKNNTLKLEIREDGLYFRAYLADTNSGQDLYKNIKSGLVDKCSFGFTIKNEVFDEKSNTFFIKEIDRLFEISAVDFPAYENTSIHARNELNKIEKQKQKLIDFERRKRNLILKTY